MRATASTTQHPALHRRGRNWLLLHQSLHQSNDCHHLNHCHSRRHWQLHHQCQQQQLGAHGCLIVPHACPSFVTTDTVTQTVFEESEYESTRQGDHRRAWAAQVRSATGRKHHLVWEPALDPPLLLESVTVVLVGPKKPISCGTIARSCSCFEVEDLRIVQPRCQHNTRSSRSVSKGAQWILHRSQAYDSLSDALSDATLSVAMTRWLPEQPNSLPDIPSLLQHPTVQQLLQQPLRATHAGSLHANQQQQQQPDQQQQQQQQHNTPNYLRQQQPPQLQQQLQQDCPGSLLAERVRLALVFGREEFGLSDEEVGACDLAAAIPIGRLQESLSLSHAVTIVLSQLYQARLSATAADPAAGQYWVTQPHQLADGYDSSGSEH